MAAQRTRGGPPKLLVELFVIAVLMAAAAIGIYFGFRSPPIHDALPLGGRNVDVSRSAAAQYEPSIAADPAQPRTLLASSIDDSVDARVYVSRDGGRSWTSRAAPPDLRGPCGLSHPDVAIGPTGAEVYASLATDTCQPPDPRLYVAVRTGPARAWVVRRIGVGRRYVFDERPAVAVDPRGTIYVAWPRIFGEFTSRQALEVSRSNDGGRTWSAPRRVGSYRGVYGVDLAAGGAGLLYLAVADGLHRSVDVLRSADGGSTWSAPRRLGRLAVPYVVGCGAGSAQARAQPQRCMSEIPSLVVTRRAVEVAYTNSAPAGTLDVELARADRALRRAVAPRSIAPSSRKSADRFVPALAYDSATGVLWACYYDTTGDPTRKHAWYTCTHSHDDGRRWSSPLHAASAKSDETATGAAAGGYGDVAGVVAMNGVAHPVWTDSRASLQLAEEIYTAAIPERPPGK